MSKTLLILGVGAAAYLLLSGKRSTTAKTGQTITLGEHMKPAAVKKGETVTVNNYRVIAERRTSLGMVYMPVGVGSVGSDLEIPITQNGLFTRNVVLEGGGILVAEVKPA